MLYRNTGKPKTKRVGNNSKNMCNMEIKKYFFSMRMFAFVAVMGCALSANAQRTCGRCEGTGELVEYCAYCKGYGEKYCSTCGGYGVRNCGYCSGSGSLRCNYCNGRGTVKNDTEYCPKCEGYRNVRCSNCSGSGKVECPARDCYEGKVKCYQCNGSGLHKWRCPNCRGTGQVR